MNKTAPPGYVVCAHYPLYFINESGDVIGKRGRSLKHQTRRGYHTVSINSTQVLVHRLVAWTFIPNPHDLPCVNHKDRDKDNNQVTNLEWCTHSHNARHALGKRVRVIDRRSGEATMVPTHALAIKMTGVNRETFRYHMKRHGFWQNRRWLVEPSE